MPFADAMLLKLADAADATALASVSDNVADGYRCVVPHAKSGDHILVLGSASVELYTVAVASALGFSCMYADTAPERLAVAQRLGAAVVDAPADGRSFGEFAVTAACVSTAEGLKSALKSTEPGGICQSAGIHFHAVELPLLEMYRRGVRFHTGRANARDDIPTILALVATGRLRPGDITADVVPIDRAVEALSGPLPHKLVLAV